MIKRNWMRKGFSILLALALMISSVPGYAAENCIHHTEHTEECGYLAEGETCHYECAECAEEEVLCSCESDDPDWHAPFCARYTAPERPECYCVEKCAEGAVNEWCEVCYFDRTSCGASGGEEAAVYADTPVYIASIGIAQDSSSGSTGIHDCKDELSGHTVIDRDLNEGAGGDYVYMGYKITVDPSEAITGIVFRVGGSPPDSITYNGYTFYLVGGSSESNTAQLGGYIDLNAKAGGDYIYMYVTRDPGYGAPLTALTVDESSAKPGYTTGTNTSGSVIDLNQKADGKYLYLHYKQFSATVKATYYCLDSNGNRKISTESATLKNHLETMTKIPSGLGDVNYDGRRFRFEGWREDDLAEQARIPINKASVTYTDNDKSFRAVYFADITLSYDANGGSGAPTGQTKTQRLNAGSSSMVKQSVKFTIPTSIYKNSSECLIGWSADPAATTAAYQPGGTVSVSRNTTLYAVYAAHSYTNGICERCGEYHSDSVAVLSKDGKNVFAGNTLDAVITEAETCTAADKAVVTILRDIDLGKNCQQIDSGVFTIDLNGCEIKNASGYGSDSGPLNFEGSSVNVTIRDSGETGKITSTDYGVTVRNGSTLTISGGTIYGPTYSVYGYKGHVVITGGIITGGADAEGVYVYNNSTVTISGGSINGNRYGVYTAAQSKVDISGGTINGVNYGVYVNYGVEMTVSGGTINGGIQDLFYDASSPVKLTLGEDDTGATFPGGITTSFGLQRILGEGAAYWAGDTMLSVGINDDEITDKGDITVKAVCSHESGTKGNYKSNGDDHTYTWSCCKQEGTEGHTFINMKCVCDARDHDCVYTNGFCVKGCYEPAERVDGYYQITNGGNLFWFAEYINTVDRTANAVLTANIDLENRAWTPIGATGEGNNNFRGHFDGQNHTITGLAVEGGRSGLGFFGEVRLGTVENFTICGEVTLKGKHNYVGGVIGSAPGANSDAPDHNGATIRNITSYVNVTLGEGSHGSNHVGGFLGYANHETEMENCSWYGTLDLGPYRAQDGVGGLIGKANDDSAVTVRNCGAYGTIRTAYKSGSYNHFDTIYIGGIVSNSVASAQTTIENTLWAGKIVNETDLGEKAHISAFGTLNGIGSVTNCYAWEGSAPYITTNGTHDRYITAVTTAQLASGEVAYKLGAAWGQAIGTDDCPIPGGQKVYRGYVDCKATEMIYANRPLMESPGVHSYENGFCTACDGCEPANGNGTEADPYQIGNAGQLYWFAEQVNGGNTSAWAELTANITVNTGNVAGCNGTKAEGWRDWTPIGIGSASYGGTFDGKKFVISGLYFNDSAEDYVGLFGYVSGGAVKNVGVEGSYLRGSYFVGGVVGYNNGTAVNCYHIGSINGGHFVGGMVGYNNGTVTNGYHAGSVTASNHVGGVMGYNYYASATNCYHDSTAYNGPAFSANNHSGVSDVLGKTREQFTSGEVACLLQGDQTEQVWGQNVDGEGEKDAYPIFSDAKVYQITNCKKEIFYSNTNENIGHIWMDATDTAPKICAVCNRTESEALCHIAVEDSYTDNGDGTHSFTCSVCGKTITEDHSYTNYVCACGTGSPDAATSVTIGGSTTYYGDLNSAVWAAADCTAADKAVVTLLKDIILDSGYQEIGSGVFTIDLKGHEIRSTRSSYDALYLKNSGTDVTVADTVGGGKITGGYAAIGVSGVSVTVSGGSLSGSPYGVYSHAGGNTVTITGGSIFGSSVGVDAYSSTLTITDGSISGGSTGVNVVAGTTATISGGSITGDSNDISFRGGTVKLTLGENGIGATFPGGIRVGGTTLDVILGEGTAYWQGDKMHILVGAPVGILGEDVTIKAVCTHTGEKTAYTNNGDDHSFTCADCSNTFTEGHTYVNGECACGAEEDPAEIISVDISWGAMEFTYDDTVDEATGEEKGWTDNGTGWVKVTNTGSTDVTVIYTYETQRTDIGGSFSDGDAPVTGPVAILPEEIKEIRLILANKPTEALDRVSVGTVKLTIE